MYWTQEFHGEWDLLMDPVPCCHTVPPAEYPQTMKLPGTTAQQKLGAPNHTPMTGYLTERYPFEGQIWLRKIITLRSNLSADDFANMHFMLELKRTRMSTLWINGIRIGSCDSLCAPHRYDLTGFAENTMEIVLCIKNFQYPTKGGHMTSPDTQTNWIGIPDAITLTASPLMHLEALRTFPDANKKTVTITGILKGALETACQIRWSAVSAEHPGISPNASPCTFFIRTNGSGHFSLIVPLPEAPLWSEYTPICIRMQLTLPESGDTETLCFGMRDFTANGDHFEINGTPIMLRGKHDGLVFPLEGAAPCNVEEWIRIFTIAKAWGINHYRFHTCCPPEACFEAADFTGIYLEPELPFWGTVHALDHQECNQEEQDYLIREGLRITAAYGNHPSFCMLSLGNELWGSTERLQEILDILRKADPRPLYTQGSNNFQHMPVSLPNEDFWTGVRLGKGKLIRGSYATCDAPIGRIQTEAPSADWDYEEWLCPQSPAPASYETSATQTEIEVQYGTGVKKVQASETQDFLPAIPVVTHEIGQYAVYPDFSEIERYTGVLQARNFEIFRERLTAAGMEEQAEDFFRCSGALARECYKMEIEAAMRSPHIAGFQLLDLQDFPGQGTALVGMLNAFMESKGLIAPEEWRSFCGDCVPLARFKSYVWTAGEEQQIHLALRTARPYLKAQTMYCTVQCEGKAVAEATTLIPASAPGYHPLGGIGFGLRSNIIGKAELILSLPEEKITNRYAITILPPVTPCASMMPSAVVTVHTMAEAMPHLQQGKRVLLLPNLVQKHIKGFYCTDFWCYPMFRSISESMGKEVPVGTMGLCIQSEHPIARAMFSEAYATPQWFVPVSHADCAILDDAPAGYRPIVQMIDNFERNHRLGLIFEARVAQGSLLVCTVRTEECPQDPSMHLLKKALLDYAGSPAFDPQTELCSTMLAETLC